MLSQVIVSSFTLGNKQCFSILANECVNPASEWLTALLWTAQVAAVILG